MIIRTLYDQGTARTPEDDMIVLPREKDKGVLGVMDGVNAPYISSVGPRIYEGGLSGGQTINRIIQIEFLYRYFVGHLPEMLYGANERVREFARRCSPDLDLDDAGVLPGACLAIAELKKDEVLIATAGDCMAVWRTKTGKIGVTKLLPPEFEQMQKDSFAALMRQYGDRSQAWKHHIPIMHEAYRRFKNTPEGFAFLNGQPAFNDLLEITVIPREELALLILFTDGFVPFEEMGRQERLAHWVLAHYKDVGLSGTLAATRFHIQEKNEKEGWETLPEATAVAIEF